MATTRPLIEIRRMSISSPTSPTAGNKEGDAGKGSAKKKASVLVEVRHKPKPKLTPGDEKKDAIASAGALVAAKVAASPTKVTLKPKKKGATGPSAPINVPEIKTMPRGRNLGSGGSEGSVKDKIAKWQANGAAAAVDDPNKHIKENGEDQDEIVEVVEEDADDDVVVVLEEESEKGIKSSVSTPAGKTTRNRRKSFVRPSAKSADNTPTKSPGATAAAVAAAVKRGKSEISDEMRAASAPRKRVISDEHWKKSRGSPQVEKKMDESLTKVIPVKNRKPEQTPPVIIPVSPRKVSPRTIKKIFELSASRKQKSESSGGKTATVPDDVDDEVDDTPTRLRKQRRRRPKPDTSADYDIDDEPVVMMPESPSPPRNMSKRKSKSPEVSREATLAAREATRRYRSETAARPATLQRSPIDAEPIPDAPVSQVPGTFGDRIDSWLASTPDPFTDAPAPAPSRREPAISPSEESQRSDPLDSPFQASSLKRMNARRGSRTVSVSPREFGSPRDGNSPHKPNDFDLGNSKEQHQRFDDEENDTFDPIPQPLFSRRRMPTTGNRLSTIASVETFHTRKEGSPPSLTSPSQETLTAPGEGAMVLHGDTSAHNAADLARRQSSKRRKLASHSDLISVLSLPRGDVGGAAGRSIISARSIRTTRSRGPAMSADDLIAELKSDEAKYMRELRTLVDGVIPVLLTCVLSKRDAAAAAGLFGATPQAANEVQVSKPIIDMGVALERLKSSHRRIPLSDPEALCVWAIGAARVYSDYLKAWRMGFQDVVVNLAPAAEAAKEDDPAGSGLNEGMEQNDEGYVVNGEGERVDVAFLLKRPLVRLKYLSKTLSGFASIKPGPTIERTAEKFQQLVIEARKRSNEERARLEDEAAATIDPTRARDLRTLAPLAGVVIDPSRCVRARDYFDMKLKHSTGQELDCKIEILYRDEAPGKEGPGDILICEIDENGRWLLFPPVQTTCLSARNGELEREIVVMLRGVSSGNQEWHEVLSLIATEEQAGFEWVNMLGLEPVPPGIPGRTIFRPQGDKAGQHAESIYESTLAPSLVSDVTSTVFKSRTPSPREVDIPIGEQAREESKKWAGTTDMSSVPATPTREVRWPSEPVVRSYSPPAYSKEDRPGLFASAFAAIRGRRPEPKADSPGRPKSPPPGYWGRDDEEEDEALSPPGSGSLKRSMAKRMSRNLHNADASPRSRKEGEHGLNDYLMSGALPPAWNEQDRQQDLPRRKSGKKGYSVWLPSSDQGSDYEDEGEEYDDEPPTSTRGLRPALHRRAASVPTNTFPSIPRTRQSSHADVPQGERAMPQTPTQRNPPYPYEQPASAPSKLQKKAPIDHDILRWQAEAADAAASPLSPQPGAPPPPAHRSAPQSPNLNRAPVPKISPAPYNANAKRRSSSPLKHEYEPSTASEASASEYDDDASHYDDDGAGSVTSEESTDTFPSKPPPGFPAIPGASPAVPSGKVSPPTSVFSPNTRTLAPSNSASQAPFRHVPATVTGGTNFAKGVASIYGWSDKGSWESLYPNDCSVVVRDGIISAYELTAIHSSTHYNSDDDPYANISPLIALELTPLVPIRRGTALDISIRSPPTPASKLKAPGTNIMFRSRTPEECEQLYGHINTARINNPTYLALQNARGPGAGQSWAEVMDRRNAARTASGAPGSHTGGSSWWKLGSRTGSYRATSTRGASSVAGVTESSVASMQSAFSALRRFGGGSNRLFNVAKSTVSSRQGTFLSGSNSLSTSNSSKSGSGSGTGTPPMASNAEGATAAAAAQGIASAKIRLYERESGSKWRDMGSARLTIMNPPTKPSGIGVARGEKRIVILGKTKGETLLDRTLGESSFERVARTGIAVSVWQDATQVKAIGGVLTAVAKVYMVQMKTERECAFCYSLLGKLRY